MTLANEFSAHSLLLLPWVGLFMFAPTDRGLPWGVEPAVACGGFYQRPCKGRRVGPFASRVGCRRWSYILRGRCHPCGGRRQAPCPVYGQGNTCKPKLTVLKGKCAGLQCGRNGQRSCTPAERIPACNNGSIEIKGLCRRRI